MNALKEKSRGELVTIIRRQQQEIDALRRRVEVLESTDVGSLRREVDELKSWKVQAEERIRDLQVTAAMAQGLMLFTATGVLALLGEKFLEVLQKAPALVDEAKRTEIREKLGDFADDLVNAITAIDGMSKRAWEQQRRVLEVRASTLPPLKRALFNALDQFAQPSKFGTQLRLVLLQTLEFDQKFDDEQLELFEVLAAVLDTVSNLWPLAAVNTLVPLLRHVGFDDAAEAAGEILDSLEEAGAVPAKLIPRIRLDLVSMGVVEEQTKPSTIAEYLVDGHQLNQFGVSPDRAATRGLIPGSPTHLKRANKAYAGLKALYNRTTEFPNNDDLENLEEFSHLMLEAAERFDTDQLVEAIPAEVAQ